MSDAQEPIVCVFSVDDAYCQHLAVAITSLIFNNPNCKFLIHIIYHDVQQTTLEKLQVYLLGIAAIEPHFHSLDVSAYNFSVSRYITVAAYFRFFIPDILPSDLSKAIYLDSDLIVLGSLRPLWNMQMGTTSIAAAVDPSANKPGFLAVFGQKARTINEQLGLPKEYRYFNSGVLVINLDAWRTKNIKDRLIKYAQENIDVMLYHDQDALNGILYNDLVTISYKWNFQAGTTKIDADYIGITVNELLEFKRKPMILHFAGGNKPWKYRRKVLFEKEYYKYLRMTPWKSYVPPDRNLKGFFGRYFSPIRKALQVRSASPS